MSVSCVTIKSPASTGHGNGRGQGCLPLYEPSQKALSDVDLRRHEFGEVEGPGRVGPSAVSRCQARA